MKKLMGVIFSVVLCLDSFSVFASAANVGSAMIPNFSGVWLTSAEFRYAFPFPMKEHAYEIWQFGQQDEISVTQVVGQHNETFSGEWTRKGETFYLTFKGQNARKYDLISIDSQHFSLCAEVCRQFSKVDSRPALPSGSYTTPAVQVDWSWDVNGTRVPNSLAMMILRDSHSDLSISGQAFIYAAPSKVAYHMVMMNYLIGEDPQSLASYGFLLLMAAVDEKTGTSKFVAGTLSEPAFFSWGDEKVFATDYDGDHVEFRLRLRPHILR